MKQIVSWVLMIAMLLSISAFAEEDFMLHNGIKFGMTIEEVIETARNNGVELTPDGSGVYCEGIEIIENQHDTESQYTFNYGALHEVKYYFSSLDSFDAVEQELIKKYGTTDYSSDTGREFPNIMEDPDMPQFSVPITSYYQDKGSNVFDAHLLKHSHRFIELDDGRGIFIEHFAWVRDFLANGTLVSAWEWHRLQYTVFEADAVTYIIKSALEEQ